MPFLLGEECNGLEWAVGIIDNLWVCAPARDCIDLHNVNDWCDDFRTLLLVLSLLELAVQDIEILNKYLRFFE